VYVGCKERGMQEIVALKDSSDGKLLKHTFVGQNLTIQLCNNAVKDFWNIFNFLTCIYAFFGILNHIAYAS
jgi:hypothetical protein